MLVPDGRWKIFYAFHPLAKKTSDICVVLDGRAKQLDARDLAKGSWRGFLRA